MNIQEEVVILLKSLPGAEISKRHKIYDRISIFIDRSGQIFSTRFRNIVSKMENVLGNYNEHLEELNLLTYRALSILESEELASKFPFKGTEKNSLTPTFSAKGKDRKRMLDLCMQIRKIVLSSEAFDHPHRVRLSNRVAAVEAEIHREKGLFDVVLGMVSDVGETLGKFGRDVKPLTDRVDEVAKIARANSEEYKQLPAPDEVTKGLPAPEQDSGETE